MTEHATPAVHPAEFIHRLHEDRAAWDRVRQVLIEPITMASTSAYMANLVKNEVPAERAPLVGFTGQFLRVLRDSPVLDSRGWRHVAEVTADGTETLRDLKRAGFRRAGRGQRRELWSFAMRWSFIHFVGGMAPWALRQTYPQLDGVLAASIVDEGLARAVPDRPHWLEGTRAYTHGLNQIDRDFIDGVIARVQQVGGEGHRADEAAEDAPGRAFAILLGEADENDRGPELRGPDRLLGPSVDAAIRFARDEAWQRAHRRLTPGHDRQADAQARHRSRATAREAPAIAGTLHDDARPDDEVAQAEELALGAAALEALSELDRRALEAREAGASWAAVARDVYGLKDRESAKARLERAAHAVRNMRGRTG